MFVVSPETYIPLIVQQCITDAYSELDDMSAHYAQYGRGAGFEHIRDHIRDLIITKLRNNGLTNANDRAALLAIDTQQGNHQWRDYMNTIENRILVNGVVETGKAVTNFATSENGRTIGSRLFARLNSIDVLTHETFQVAFDEFVRDPAVMNAYGAGTLSTDDGRKEFVRELISFFKGHVNTNPNTSAVAIAGMHDLEMQQVIKFLFAADISRPAFGDRLDAIAIAHLTYSVRNDVAGSNDYGNMSNLSAHIVDTFADRINAWLDY